MKKQNPLLIFIAFLVICVYVSLHDSHLHVKLTTLKTRSRWIVDENGKRVKLACINWPAHLETMLAEGLSKQPLDVISKKIPSMGFNCVRLTYPTYLATNQSSVTVEQSFHNSGVTEFITGIQAYNPSLLHLSLLQAFQAVVSNLGKNNLMVILDNHISQPGWCCDKNDGNGFFGDPYFDPNLWLQGLSRMAMLFNGTTNVVAMSLRNELRGPKQNADDWYRYMQQGAEAVHTANPNVLVILSGLGFSTDLSFLQNKPVNITFTGKLVFEVHWYSFFAAWDNDNANQLCGRIASNVTNKVGFLVHQGWPLILSEFGVNLKRPKMHESEYLDCLLDVAAKMDLEWGLWGLQGSYYLRQGKKDAEEEYGVLSFDWSRIRSPSFMQKIASIQSPVLGPGI